MVTSSALRSPTENLCLCFQGFDLKQNKSKQNFLLFHLFLAGFVPYSDSGFSSNQLIVITECTVSVKLRLDVYNLYESQFLICKLPNTLDFFREGRSNSIALLAELWVAEEEGDPVSTTDSARRRGRGHFGASFPGLAFVPRPGRPLQNKDFYQGFLLSLGFLRLQGCGVDLSTRSTPMVFQIN